jgi:hypothetical protein
MILFIKLASILFLGLFFVPGKFQDASKKIHEKLIENKEKNSILIFF